MRLTKDKRGLDGMLLSAQYFVGIFINIFSAKSTGGRLDGMYEVLKSRLGFLELGNFRHNLQEFFDNNTGGEGMQCSNVNTEVLQSWLKDLTEMMDGLLLQVRDFNSKDSSYADKMNTIPTTKLLSDTPDVVTENEKILAPVGAPNKAFEDSSGGEWDDKDYPAPLPVPAPKRGAAKKKAAPASGEKPGEEIGADEDPAAVERARKAKERRDDAVR